VPACLLVCLVYVDPYVHACSFSAHCIATLPNVWRYGCFCLSALHSSLAVRAAARLPVARQSARYGQLSRPTVGERRMQKVTTHAGQTRDMLPACLPA